MASYSTKYKVFDLETYTLHATSFQKWRMKRLINKLSPAQKILLGKISHTKVNVKVYSPSVMLGPLYKVRAYTDGSMYELNDDYVISYYGRDKPEGTFYDEYDDACNQWYRYGEGITWTNKLFKLLMLYNRVVGAYSVRSDAAHSRDKFMSKLTGTDNV